jgi:pSer/pThr/pTyr-binding forkhead associated (FHA) protein
LVPSAPPPPATLNAASLVVRASGAILALPAAAQAVVGRADPVSNFAPDLDLTPHGAIESGVGRRHARLFVQGGQILIEDLDSTNGTFRNGVRLAPRQPTPVANGDELRLGSLTLAVQL